MAVSKAQQKAVAKYVKSKYDRFGLTMPKGNLDTIKTHADNLGESVNGFINRVVNEAIEGEPPAAPPKASASLPLAQGIVLPPDTQKAAGEAVRATGEDLTEFVARSVGEQVKRDKVSFQMGINPATGEKVKGGSTHE